MTRHTATNARSPERILSQASLCAEDANRAALDGVTRAEAYRVTEVGPHHRVWTRVRWRTNSLGQMEAVTNRYTELATGLHYLRDGQWVESREEIELASGGAAARAGQHKVRFAANLATAGGLELELPDGRRLRGHVLGLSYHDAGSGKSVLLAAVRDSVGQVHRPNVMVSRDGLGVLQNRQDGGRCTDQERPGRIWQFSAMPCRFASNMFPCVRL